VTANESGSTFIYCSPGAGPDTESATAADICVDIKITVHFPNGLDGTFPADRAVGGAFTPVEIYRVFPHMRILLYTPIGYILYERPVPVNDITKQETRQGRKITGG
jgi:hypothetical protein